MRKGEGQKRKSSATAKPSDKPPGAGEKREDGLDDIKDIVNDNVVLMCASINATFCDVDEDTHEKIPNASRP